MPVKKTAAKVATDNGDVTIDPAASYALTLGKALAVPGTVLLPADRNIEVSGEVLLAAAADAAEGTFIHVTQIQ